MKKYIYKVLSVGVISSLALSSCTDLTEPVYDAIPADQFLKTDAQIAAALGPAYGGLRGITWDWFNPSEASSDELIVPTRGGDWYVILGLLNMVQSMVCGDLFLVTFLR